MTTPLTTLDAEIERLIVALAEKDLDTPEYDLLHNKLTKLLESRQHPNPINWNTVLLVGANLLGIGVVLSYERLNIITSKAFGQIMRPR